MDSDVDLILRKARRDGECAECGSHLDHHLVPRSPFCGPRCRYRFRDRRRYAEDPEAQREKARRYYLENREAVLARAAERRAARRAAKGDAEEPTDG
jgi:hypothetical protein